MIDIVSKGFIIEHGLIAYFRLHILLIQTRQQHKQRLWRIADIQLKQLAMDIMNFFSTDR